MKSFVNSGLILERIIFAVPFIDNGNIGITL